MFRKTRDTFAEFPEFYVIFASSLIAKRDKQVKVIVAIDSNNIPLEGGLKNHTPRQERRI